MYFGYSNYKDDSKRTLPTHSVTENPYVNHAQKISGKVRAKKVPIEKQIAAVEKIQTNYRRHDAQLRFKNNRNQMKREGDDFVQRQLDLCDRGGDVVSRSDFNLPYSPTDCLPGWREFYPDSNEYPGFDKNRDGRTFYWDRVENADDPYNVKVYQGDMNLRKQKHGFGKLTTPKDIKIGNWQNDEFGGWCIQGRRNGPTTEAKFVNGVAEGKGHRHDKKYEYTGDFVNNKMDGKGQIRFLENGEEYEGDFQNGQINGQGIFRWPNGDVYEGEMVKGKRSGNGKYRYAGGQVYEGEYNSEGKKEGRGSVLFTNGASYNANFRRGKPQGIADVTTKHNEKLQVEFMDGKASRIVDRPGMSIRGSTYNNVVPLPNANHGYDQPIQENNGNFEDRNFADTPYQNNENQGNDYGQEPVGMEG